MVEKYVICIDDGGVKEVLASGNIYRVLDEENGKGREAFYKLFNSGLYRWFLKKRFEKLPNTELIRLLYGE